MEHENIVANDLFNKAKKLVTLQEYNEASNVLWRALAYYRGACLGITTFIKDVIFSSTECKTCRINLSTGVVIINPNFFDTYIAELNDLIWIMLHERGHLLIRIMHPNNKSFAPELETLIQDSYINRTLIKLTSSTLADRFYTKDNPLTIPLRTNAHDLKSLLDKLAFAVPTKNLITQVYTYAATGSVLWPEYKKVLEILYRKLLSDEKQQYPSLKKSSKNNDDVANEANKAQKRDSASTHCGKNSSGNTGYSNIASELVEHNDPYPISETQANDLSEIVKASSTFLNKVNNKYDDDDDAVTTTVDIPTNMNANSGIRARILNISSSSILHGKSPFIQNEVTSNDLTVLSAGHIPILWDMPITKPEMRWSLYVDVSYSLKQEWGKIIEIALSLERFMNDIYQFSGGVIKINKKGNLKKIITGNSTNFNAVAESILETRAKNVIIATDNRGALLKTHVTKLRYQLNNIVILKMKEWLSTKNNQKGCRNRSHMHYSTWEDVTPNCISIY